MRIARVLHPSSTTPIVALERDGALYSVAALDRRWGTRYSPERMTGADDFHTRVIALGCAGLEALDERLRSGTRPTEARLFPEEFLWLPPCDPARSAYVQMGPAAPGEDAEPWYWFGPARAFVGHDTAVSFPPDEEEPELELSVAAVLGEDLRRATAAEAERAILGTAIVSAWTARQRWRRDRARGAGETRARDFGAQLGPVLVTRGELPDPSGLATRVSVGASGDGVAPTSTPAVGSAGVSLAEAIAFVSQHVELAAGDIVGASRFTALAVPYGATATVAVERLGVLSGRPVRGPEPIAWRRPR